MSANNARGNSRVKNIQGNVRLLCYKDESCDYKYTTVHFISLSRSLCLLHGPRSSPNLY